MTYNPDEIGHSATYKILTGAVIPRPIGWISTVNKEGLPNLAPFSYFNIIGDDPPHVMFSTVRTHGGNKDTLNNVLATGEFVVNMVTEDTVQQMNLTAQQVAPEINEFELANLTQAPSILVSPPRVLESPIHFECKLVHHYELEDHTKGGAVMLVGKVVMFHIQEGYIDDQFKINESKYRPIARLAGANYTTIGNVFSIKRS
jgi:flavin reductase (DIM6/NTAB) family NADH-FMN oxidoreductase RutF